jgi:hypothetical protein
MSLAPAFKVRLCNFKAHGVNQLPRIHPPFVVRGNFDGRAFNSEAFHSITMQPMWALDFAFEYTNAPTIESLPTRYLIVECYGDEAFIGMCRVDLYTLATGPRCVDLALREGGKTNGTISFECFFEMLSTVTAQVNRLTLQNVAPRGYENKPNCYVAYALSPDGSTTLESPVAQNAVTPEWDKMAPLHIRTTFNQLTNQRLRFELKHSRNGFTAGISDPVMAVFEVSFDRLPLEAGRDGVVHFREMVHSLPNYPFPFSTEVTGAIEFRNMHRVAQARSGALTNEGITGVAPPVVSIRSFSPPRHPQPAARLGSPVKFSSSAQPSFRPVSPASIRYAASASAINSTNNTFASNSVGSSTYMTHYQSTMPPPVAIPVAPMPPPPAPLPGALQPSFAAPMPAATPLDLEMLDEVSQKQHILLEKVRARIAEVSRRKIEITSQMQSHKHREETEIEVASQRRLALDNDMRSTLAERERLEEALRSIAFRREEEQRAAAQLAVERERARRALEEEQQEALLMQQRVIQLRNEMQRHLEDEERRYQERVRDAEEARRRTQQDADALAALEARMTEAEARTIHRVREEHSRSVRRTKLSPARR